MRPLSGQARSSTVQVRPSVLGVLGAAEFRPYPTLPFSSFPAWKWLLGCFISLFFSVGVESRAHTSLAGARSLSHAPSLDSLSPRLLLSRQCHLFCSEIGPILSNFTMADPAFSVV